MTRRELNVFVAERVMGWKHLEFTRDDGTKFVHFISPSGISEYITSRNPVEVPAGDEDNAPRYTDSLDLAVHATGRLAAERDRRLFGLALNDYVNPSKSGRASGWEMIQASALDRCRAMYTALTGEECEVAA